MYRGGEPLGWSLLGTLFIKRFLLLLAESYWLEKRLPNLLHCQTNEALSPSPSALLFVVEHLWLSAETVASLSPRMAILQAHSTYPRVESKCLSLLSS